MINPVPVVPKRDCRAIHNNGQIEQKQKSRPAEPAEAMKPVSVIGFRIFSRRMQVLAACRDRRAGDRGTKLMMESEIRDGVA